MGSGLTQLLKSNICQVSCRNDYDNQDLQVIVEEQGAYPECGEHAECSSEPDMFCGVECWTGGCGDGTVAEQTLGNFCQPCDHCHRHSDGVDAECGHTCGFD